MTEGSPRKSRTTVRRKSFQTKFVSVSWGLGGRSPTNTGRTSGGSGLVLVGPGTGEIKGRIDVKLDVKLDLDDLNG